MRWLSWMSSGLLLCFAQFGICDADGPLQFHDAIRWDRTPSPERHRGKIRVPKFTRTYYVGAVEVDWDYAPYGNLLGERADRFANLFLSSSDIPLRLGKVYKKAVFREFTDASYAVQKKRERWQGILGPTIRGEVGDLAVVHFYNNATVPLTMHPHGARYLKIHEGALYEDDTTDEEKMDDMVFPGNSHTYYWYFIPEDGPTLTDPDCLTWMYHSHRNADTDIHAGLLGPIIVCRPGTLDKRDRPRNVDRSFVLLFTIFDENDSLYIDENIRRVYPRMRKREMQKIKKDARFRQSNRMFSVNGLGFGNLKGLDMCIGEKIGWHIVGMGNEVDVHSISFESQVFTVNGKTTDIISLFPAKFTTSLMIASREGTFPFRCEVGPHAVAGMESTFTVDVCSGSRRVQPKLSGLVREYYIAAEEIFWDYAPSGINRFNGLPLTEDKLASVFFTRNATRIGGEYKKAVYREYKDPSFTQEKIRGYEEAHLALLGPTLRAEVGDVIKIIFKNKANRPYNLHTHGAYNAPGEIERRLPAPAIDFPSSCVFALGDDIARLSDEIPVSPGHLRTYNWPIAEQYGPTPSDPQCLTWRYYSNVDVERDIYDGLSGTLLTCRPGTLDKRGKQKNVDREFSLMFSVMDESMSHLLGDNIMHYTSLPDWVNITDPAFIESNQMHAINGRVYGNLEGLSMCVGERVSWHIAAFGKAIDLHTAYFHGQTFQQGGKFKDTLAVAPSTHYTVLMHTDNPGDWPLVCRTNDHYSGGMRAVYRVEDCGSSSLMFPEMNYFGAPGRIREYFIAAVEGDWNYAPVNRHIVDGRSLLENEESRLFVEKGYNRIGRVYKKVLYREYTDGTFTMQKPQSRSEEHLSIMGPFIRAEIGDIIRVVFRNMASRPYNIHPHGVLLERFPSQSLKDHVENDEQPVDPGETVVYEWPVPERAGPGRTGFNCSSWAYYSSVDVVKDTNSGLIGPLITCKPGILSSAGYRGDVDHEFAVLFTIFDENQSWYLQENIRRFASNALSVNTKDPDFVRSNKMHAVNGRLYGSLDGLVARRDSLAAWYLIGMGTEIDMHTAHFHGQTFLRRTDSTRRADVVYLFPGVFETVEMIMDNPGTWFLHCHVDDHMRAGMAAVYTVQR